VEGGEPRRITYFGTPYTRAVGWTSGGRVLVCNAAELKRLTGVGGLWLEVIEFMLLTA
jgi:tricorn protease-like protein